MNKELGSINPEEITPQSFNRFDQRIKDVKTKELKVEAEKIIQGEPILPLEHGIVKRGFLSPEKEKKTEGLIKESEERMKNSQT